MIVLLTTADTELLALRAARAELPDGFGAVHGFNPATWSALDVDRELLPLLDAGARCVAVRLLGGRRAIPDAFDRMRALCASRDVAFVAWPGDRQPDAELSAVSTVAAEVVGSGFAYLAARRSGVTHRLRCRGMGDITPRRRGPILWRRSGGRRTWPRMTRDRWSACCCIAPTG